MESFQTPCYFNYYNTTVVNAGGVLVMYGFNTASIAVELADFVAIVVGAPEIAGLAIMIALLENIPMLAPAPVVTSLTVIVNTLYKYLTLMLAAAP